MQTNDLAEANGLQVKALLFLKAIKNETAESHVFLESQTLLSAIISPAVTVHQYYCYLALMKKIEEVYEKDILSEAITVLSDHEQQKASQLIADDLQNLGDVLQTDLEIKNYSLPEKISKPFALGFMYVMEGSKLGGKVIYKHIQRTLGLSEGSGAKFISDYGADTFVLWKQFLSQFSAYVAQNDGEEEAIKGAKYAFTSIYDFFESNRLVYAV